MSGRLRTVLVGFGKMGAGYAADPVMTRAYPYAVHAQVLRDHPAFRWDAVVDPQADARAAAVRDWGAARAVATVADLPDAGSYDVAVIATPPEHRAEMLAGLPGLKAILVEKPLARSVADGERLLAEAAARKILVQVNFQRRADPTGRALASGGLAARIGKVQCAFATYGNGLENNGTHLIDWIRFLLGEVTSVRRLDEFPAFREGPIDGDVNPAFCLAMAGGFPVMVSPLRFSAYRELSIEIWGTEGRLALQQEGLTLVSWPKLPNRGLSGAFEVSGDRPTVEATGCGTALYCLYENLTAALAGREALCSPGESAVQTMRIVETLLGTGR
jgi:predicted dehydrogenase